MHTHNKAKPTQSRAPWAGGISLLSMVLLLGGCTVGPDFVRPEARLNENWNENGDPRVKTQTALDGNWWSVFQDPTLDQLIQLAYRQNLPLQIAGLRILEARAQLAIALGQQWPQQQQAFGDITNVGLSKNAPNQGFPDLHFWDFRLGFDAAWELDFWGRFRRGVEAARANLVATTADYDYALVSLTAEVARTYTVMRTSEVFIELARKNAALQEEGLRIAQSRFRNGATTELDVSQARALWESTRATIPKFQIQLQQARNALSTLLGQPTGALQDLLDGQKGIPVAPLEVAVSVPAELLRRRPDIRSAELQAAAQSARIGIAKADLYPSFSLLGRIGFETSSGGGSLSSNAGFENLFDAGSLFYSFGPSFRWPLFNYGVIKGNVRVQDARFQQLVVNYQNTVLRVAQEVEDALTGILRSQEARVSDQNSVTAAQRSVEIAMSQYREGATDYERVIDSERFLLQQENNLAQTNSSIATNLIALYKALGGGWELRLGQPVVPESMQAEMRARTNWGRLLPAQPAPETLNPPPPAREIPLLSKPQW